MSMSEDATQTSPEQIHTHSSVFNNDPVSQGTTLVDNSGQQQKKRKLGEGPQDGPSNSSDVNKSDNNQKKRQCQFFLAKKNRYCKMLRTNSGQYCAEHVILAAEQLRAQTFTKPDKDSLSTDASTLANKKYKKEERKRVPCPLDPNHTVWESKLNSHLQKCNKKKLATIPATQPFFKKDYNLGPKGAKTTSEPLPKDQTLALPKPNTPEYYQHWIPIIQTAFRLFLSSSDAANPLPLDVKDIRDAEHRVATTSLSVHGTITSRFAELTNQKHIVQQSSLIGHLRENGLYGAEYGYVEFGCGRAELSRYVAKSIMFDKMSSKHQEKSTADKKAFKNSNQWPSFLLIDRSPVRMKMDGKIQKDFRELERDFKNNKEGVDKEKQAEGKPATSSNVASKNTGSEQSSGPYVHRVKVDIKDLYLDNLLETVPQFRADSSSLTANGTNKDLRNFVAISKHLCGCATDLTLSCLLNSQYLSGTHKDGKFAGLVVAMCCRHVCNYNMLLPQSKLFLSTIFQNALRELNITDAGFDIREAFKVLSKLCSWATCGQRSEKPKAAAPDDDNSMEPKKDQSHTSRLSYVEREQLGLMARRLIDESRVHAVRESGYHGKLVRYVEKDVSLENVCLVVLPDCEPK